MECILVILYDYFGEAMKGEYIIGYIGRIETKGVG